MSLVDEKAALRALVRERRSACDPVVAGRQLAARVLDELRFAEGLIVAMVWPLPGEIDLRPLMVALHEGRVDVVLPQTPSRGQSLLFRRWRPGCTMIPDRFGTARPDGETADPSVIFVPMLAFDRAGNRLGYGGGYYDRTLACCKDSISIGFGFAAQEVPAVPTEPHDMPVNLIATDQNLFATTLNKQKSFGSFLQKRTS